MSVDNDEPSAAADVSFVKLSTEHHAESSSQAESRQSSEKRKSSTSDKLARHRGKRSSGIESPSSTHTSRLPRKTGGFLLEAVFTNGRSNEEPLSQRHGKAASPNGHVQSHQRSNRVSGESSRRGSPLSREVSVGDDSRPGVGRQAESRSMNMDPSQLVQMALNLSESRKRNVSSSLPLPISPAGGRRVTSALDSGYGTVKSTPSSGKRASHLKNDHYDSSPGSTKMSENGMDDEGGSRNGDNILYTFSPATLSRAERARKYFELASEHRRLLDHLPPLKPDATAPGNYTTQATSSPGSAHYHVERISSNTQSKHQLGRAYNPLQALRNRRLRNRERRPLTAPPATWQEPERTKQWVDGVETAAKGPRFRPGDDQIRLPTFYGELEADAVRPDTAKRHRRSDTAGSVVTRPENGWSIEPAELLADTYWTENDNNKTIVEDRNGKRIFPSRARMSLEVPRRSKESEHGIDDVSDKRSQQNDSDHDDRVRHRRRNMLPIPGRLRRNRANRSGSTSSASSDEGRKPPPLQFGSSEGGDENIGPLERHMRRMIAKDENGELSSPELVSPDHWDSKHTQFSSVRSSFEGQRLDSGTSSGRHRLTVDTSGHSRSRSADGRMGSVGHCMASVDEVMSDSPVSPTKSRQATPVAEKFTGQKSKRSSALEHTSKLSHIPILRNRSKERNKTDRTDFATGDRNSLPPVVSSEASFGQPRSSFDSSRPFVVKRHRTNESTSSSLYQASTAAASTDMSARDGVGRRFLKAGRIGELVRNEGSRLGDRFRGSRDKAADPGMIADVSRPQSEASDTEDLDSRRTGGRFDDRGETDSQISPRGSLEQQRRTKFFNQNLPSFKSPSGRNKRSTAETPMSEQSNPFDGQQKPGGEADASGPRRLPKINLPNEESDPNSDIDRHSGFDFGHDRRKSASQNILSLVPSNVTVSRPKRQDGLPVTGLSGHDARRHWSISDQAQPIQINKVTVRDIARVRALLLTSGIKAHEIRLKAETPRDATLPLLSKVAATTGQRIDRIARKEEDVVAARLLSDDISKTLADFEHLLQRFQSETTKDLHTQLDNLAHRASEQLTNIVYETSDEADAFNVELTTKQPQEIKRVDDAVDAIIRQRRRQFRLVRRAGFKLLEWLVLGIMWWVWFIVVLFNTAKKSLVGIVRVLRWLLWF